MGGWVNPMSPSVPQISPLLPKSSKNGAKNEQIKSESSQVSLLSCFAAQRKTEN